MTPGPRRNGQKRRNLRAHPPISPSERETILRLYPYVERGEMTQRALGARIGRSVDFVRAVVREGRGA